MNELAYSKFKEDQPEANIPNNQHESPDISPTSSPYGKDWVSKSLTKPASSTSRLEGDDKSLSLAEDSIAKLLKKFYKSQTLEKFLAFVTWVESKKAFPTTKIYGNIKDFKFFPSTNISVMMQQKAQVTCIAITPDSKYFAIGFDYSRITLWDFKKFLEIGDFKQNSTNFLRVTSIAMSDEWLFSGGFDCLIHQWNIKTREIQHIFESGHSNPILSLSISQFASYLVSGAEDTLIMIYDIHFKTHRKIEGGHTAPVSCVVINKDEELIYSCSWDKTIKIWKLKDLTLEGILEGHTEMIRAIDLSPNGRQLASVGDDRKLKIWNLIEKKEEFSFEAHSDTITSVKYSPDGGLVVTGGYDKVLKVWNIKKVELKKILEGHTDQIKSLVISGDGKKIITGGNDQTIRVWGFDKDYEKHLLQGHKDIVIAITTITDNLKAISGGREGIIYIWDLTKAMKLYESEQHKGDITALACSSDGSRYASGDSEGWVKIWDNKYAKIEDEKYFNETVILLRFNNEDSSLISGCSDGNIRIYSLLTHQTQKSFNVREGLISTMEVTPNSSLLLMSNKANFYKFSVWEIKRSFSSIFSSFQHKNQITSIKTTRSSNKGITGDLDGVINIWDLVQSILLRTIEAGKEAGILSMEISKDSFRILTGHIDNTIRFWDLETGEQTGISEGHAHPISVMTLTGDGEKIISTGGSSHTLKILIMNKLKTIRVFNKHKKEVKTLDLSKDGKILVSGSADNTICIWDLRTNGLVGVLEGHLQKVLALKLSKDNKKLISAGADHTIRIWDFVNKTCISVIKKVGGWISGMVLSKDELNVLVSCYDGGVYYLNLEKQEIISSYLHKTRVECIEMSQSLDELVAYSGDFTGNILIYDLVTNKQIQRIKGGHAGSVNSLVVSVDKRLFSGGADNLIKIWDVINDKLQLVEIFTAHTGDVMKLIINPIGNKLLSCSADKMIYMWDINNYKQIGEFEGHTASVTTVCISPDGKAMYSGGDDKTIRIWNLNDSRSLPFLNGHTQSITRLAMTTDGKYLVSGSEDRTVIIWDTKKNLQKSVLSGFDGKISGLAITSDGLRLIVGTEGLKTTIWDLEKSSLLDFFQYSLANCRDLILVPGNQKVIIGYSDSLIRLWDINRKEMEGTYEGHCGLVSCLLLTNFSDNLLSGSEDQTIIIWDVKSKERLNTLKGHEKQVNTLCFNWDNSILYSGGDDKRVIMWDFKTCNQLKTFETVKNPINSIKITSDNQKLLVGCAPYESLVTEKKKNLYVWSLKNYQLLPLFDKKSIQGCTSILLSPNNDNIYVASHEKDIYIFNFFTESHKSLKGHSKKITAETLSQDCSFIVLADNDLVITVWDLALSKRKASLEGHKGLIHGLLMTSDNTIISASQDKTIGIWDKSYGVWSDGDDDKNKMFALQGHTAGVLALAISSDESLLISSSEDHSIRLWNIIAKLQLRRFDTKNDVIYALYMNLNGDSFLSGGKERKIMQWNVENEVELPINLAIVNSQIEMLTMSPNQKMVIVFLSSKNMQIWDAMNYTLMSEFPNCPHFRSKPVFLSRNDNRLILYFDKLIDCFTGEIIFTFQTNQDISSFFFDFKNNVYFYLSKSFDLYQLNMNWLATYLFKYLNYDSLSVLRKDPDFICNRKMSCFPFFFSFMHLISIFDKSDLFTSEKLKEIYSETDSQTELFSTFYYLDIFLNTPLDILIQRKNTTLIVKYFKVLFQYFNDKAADYYNKTRFLTYNFRDEYNLANLLCDLSPLIGDDLSIFNDLFDLAYLPLDESIYDNSYVYKELNEPIFIETDSLYTNDKAFIESELLKLEIESKEKKEKDDNEENRSMVKAKIICLPGFNNINLEKTNELYGILGNAQPTNIIFSNKVLSMLADHIWKNQIAFYYKIELLVFLVFFLLFNLNFLYLYQMRTNQYNYESYLYNISTTIIDILIIFNSLYTLINELRQLSQGIANYFKYIWNYFDIALIPLAITTALLDISMIYIPSQRDNISVIKLIFAISMFCFWFRFLSFFRALKDTSFMIRLIFNVITGVKSFVLFMVLFMLMLSASFFMLQVDQVGVMPSFWATMLVFYNTTTGDSSGITSATLAIPSLSDFFMIISTFLFAIMLMNLLVSIIGDHHSDIKESEGKTRLYELVNILCDTNSSLTTQIAKKIFPPKQSKVFLIKLYNDKHEVETFNEHEQLTNDIEEKIAGLIEGTNSKIENIEKKYIHFEKKNNATMDEIKNEMKKNKEEVRKMFEKEFGELKKYLVENMVKNKK